MSVLAGRAGCGSLGAPTTMRDQPSDIADTQDPSVGRAHGFRWAWVETGDHYDWMDGHTVARIGLE
jgi:hypothetical protein